MPPTLPKLLVSLRALLLFLFAWPLAAAPAAENAKSYAFAIPPGPLSDSLENFSRVTGYDVAARADRVGGKNTRALQGTYPAEAALGQLLAGTGLSYRVTGPRTIAIVAPKEAPATPRDASMMPEVVVSATRPGDPLPPYAGGQVAEGGRVGLLGDRSVFDTPFSTASFTEEFVRNRQARTMADVLLTDPSVKTERVAGGFYEGFVVRGFGLRSSESALNGLFGLGSEFTNLPQPYERIELFKGPNALLNGKVGSVGGSINLVTKRATDEPITRITESYASDSNFTTHLDVGRRFGDEKQFGVRVNGAYSDGDTQVQFGAERFALTSIGLDYRWKGLRLSADGIYQKRHLDGPRSQVFVSGNIPYIHPPDAHKSFQQEWEFTDGTDLIGMVRLDADLTRNISVYGAIGGRRSHNTQSREFVGIYEGYLDPSEGDYLGYPSYNRSDLTLESSILGARARFALGPTKHELNISANRIRDHGSYVSADLYDTTLFPDGVPNNLYRPRRFARPAFPNLPYDPPDDTESISSSLAFADIISMFDERVQLIAGQRLQRVEAYGLNPFTGQAAPGYDEQKWTPAYTLLVKPWKRLSLYGSYIQALEQGPVAPEGTSNAGEIFPPNDTEQYEAGAKLDFGKFGLTLAFFQISQPNGITVGDSGPGALPRFTVDGEQRNRGVEFGVFGEPWKGVRVLAGLTYLDAKLQKTEGGLRDGSDAPGISDWAADLGVEWDTPWVPGLTLTGRMSYQSEQIVASGSAVDVEIPDWTRLDLGLRYATNVHGRRTVFRALCENVADRNYWESGYVGYIIARPRTFLMSVTVDF